MAFKDLPTDVRAQAEAWINRQLHQKFWSAAADEFGLTFCPAWKEAA